ncbi:MAG: hypothetical protein ABIQ74_13830 [Chitinophagales bacterium]
MLPKISKYIACSLLAVIVYAHVCTMWCAGMSGCIKMDISENEDCGKSCCKNTQNPESRTADCQKDHIAFFNATGKFFTGVNNALAKPFQALAAIVTPQLFISTSDSDQTIVAYNGFHPPPPKADIRISISSFQI